MINFLPNDVNQIYIIIEIFSSSYVKIDYELFQTNLTEQDVELFMNLTYQVLFVSWKVLIGSLTNDDDDGS